MTGFHDWFEGLKLVLIFMFMVGVPCVLVAIFGSRMINDLGNFPSKTAEIQVRSFWILIAEVVFAVIALIVYRLLT